MVTWFGIFWNRDFLDLCWIYVRIHQFGNANVPLAILITILFIFILLVFIIIQGFSFFFFFFLLFHRKAIIIITSLFGFSAWWVIWEWLRSELFTSFPWLFLGYSQIHFPFKGFAPLIGVYGVSLIVALIIGCLYLLFFHKEVKIKILSVLVIVIFLLMGGSSTTRQWTHS
ncbi:hypothetical protein [Coxiella-like endosymbiont]|uniref:hypothetical protein n=1 Tax=Coxiella-like endosymbiont TaxID=1592897 RepID=UPI00272CD4E1|nr:hypothetical protein [Coxiella-like endosymbiont]